MDEASWVDDFFDEMSDFFEQLEGRNRTRINHCLINEAMNNGLTLNKLLSLSEIRLQFEIRYCGKKTAELLYRACRAYKESRRGISPTGFSSATTFTIYCP